LLPVSQATKIARIVFRPNSGIKPKKLRWQLRQQSPRACPEWQAASVNVDGTTV
jgi:hypothetical protein